MYFIERFLLGAAPALQGIMLKYEAGVQGQPIEIQSAYVDFDASYGTDPGDLPSIGLAWNSIIENDETRGRAGVENIGEIMVCTIKATINKGSEQGATLISRVSDMTQLIDMMAREARVANGGPGIQLRNVRRVGAINMTEGEDPVATVDYSLAYFYTRPN